MAKIKIDDSVFNGAKNITIETNGKDQSSWKSHATSRLFELSKSVALQMGTYLITESKAVITGFFDTLNLPKIGREKKEKLVTSIEEIALLRGIDLNNRPKPEMTEEESRVNQIYANKLKDFKHNSMWENHNKNLTIIHMNNGDKIDGSKSWENGIAGVVSSTDKKRGNDKGFKFAAGVELSSIVYGMNNELCASVTGYSKKYLGSKDSGTLCIINTNYHVVEHHNFLKEKTGLDDSAVADYILWHEGFHCLEISRRIELAERQSRGKELGVDIPATEKMYSSIMNISVNMSNVSNGEFDKENARRAAINSISFRAYNEVTGHEAEEYADAGSLVAMIKQGIATTDNIRAIAQIRRDGWSEDTKHDTSSLLFNIADNLDDNKNIIANWQDDYNKNKDSGKPMNIKDIDAWVLDIWTAHSAARNDKRHLIESTNTYIKGFSRDKNTTDLTEDTNAHKTPEVLEAPKAPEIVSMLVRSPKASDASSPSANRPQ